MKFSEELWDGFDAVSQKAEIGIASARDVLSFFRKKALAEEEYTRAINKMYKSATKSKRVMFQPMNSETGFVTEDKTLTEAWQLVVQATENEEKMHELLSIRLTESTVNPMTTFIAAHEKSIKNLNMEGNRIIKELKDAMNALDKAKAAYIKACNEEVAGKHALENSKSGKPKDIQKLSLKAISLTERAEASKIDYKKKIDIANETQFMLYKVKMPKILDEFEQLGSERVRVISDCIQKFHWAIQSLPEQTQSSVSAVDKAGKIIDHASDVEMFITQHKTYRSPPPEIQFEEFVPSSPEPAPRGRRLTSLFGGKKKQTSTSDLPSPDMSTITPAPANRIFDRKLSDVIDLEPDSPIPRVLRELTATIVRLHGYETEGIFRVPANTLRLQELKGFIEADKWTEIRELTDADIHPLACLLKLWLRSLADPLIPATYYNKAVEACNVQEDCIAVFDTIPSPNQEVVAFLLTFLRLFTRPDVIEYTKMGPDNLAMVFSPSFLRCPVDDPIVIMTNCDREKKFVKHLILCMDTPEEELEAEEYEVSDEAQGLGSEDADPQIDAAVGDVTPLEESPDIEVAKTPQYDFDPNKGLSPIDSLQCTPMSSLVTPLTDCPPQPLPNTQDSLSVASSDKFPETSPMDLTETPNSPVANLPLQESISSETPEYSDSPDILEPTILDPVVTPETEDAEFLEPEQAEALPKSDAQIEPTEPSEPIPEVCHQEELVVNHEKEKVEILQTDAPLISFDDEPEIQPQNTTNLDLEPNLL